jgi:hypothetical protein
MPYIIFDGTKKYLDVRFKTRSKAEYERSCLLKYFPEDNEWHQRLTVKEVSELKKIEPTEEASE